MKSIVLATLVILGGLTLFTSCPQPIVDPICAISDGLGLSSDKTAVTTDGTAITLTVSVCANISAPPVEFFDAGKSVGTLSKPTRTQSPDGYGNTFDLYSLPVSMTKTQNGSHVYTAKITLRGRVETTNEVTVTVNIP
jgi:hypothetical protein